MFFWKKPAIEPIFNRSLALKQKPAPLRPLEQCGNNLALQTTQIDRLQAEDLTGEGIGIAVLDSGGANHPDMAASKIAVFKDFWNNKESANFDDNEHGTAVNSLLVGTGASLGGKIKGVAPGAHLAVLKVTDENGTTTAFELVKALRWVKENREKYNIQVVNMSVGLIGGEDRVADELKQLDEMGIIVCASAGNDPRPNKFSAFKGSPNIITVTSSDTRGTADAGDDRLSQTASRPHPEDPVGPDVAIPGLDIVSATPAGKYRRYEDGGTSFASAIGSGAMALWKQAIPSLTRAQAQEAIVATSRPLADTPKSWQGAGTLQAWDGLQFLRGRV